MTPGGYIAWWCSGWAGEAGHYGRNTGTGGLLTVRNASWNGTLGAGASTSFGFTVGGGSSAPAALACSGS
ncbi:cellulose binding domain-containing protein [Streptomyces achromogenes]|uniref:cellulose binding domain-containing protein n=1 Tax=Streptomyces achromogenes TaxID=67255 RepID=UPI0033D12975